VYLSIKSSQNSSNISNIEADEIQSHQKVKLTATDDRKDSSVPRAEVLNYSRERRLITGQRSK
jgi:hypothetical protein